MNLNPSAVEDALRFAGSTKAELAAAVGVSTGHLADMLVRRKGTSPTTVHKMAAFLHVAPETLAPTLTDRFVAVRESDLAGVA